ncbi:MAG: CHAT domain-containing protein [Acidimicrobiales bacterium]
MGRTAGGAGLSPSNQILGPPDPTCRLGFVDGRITARIDGPADRPVVRLPVTRAAVDDLLAEHDRILGAGDEPGCPPRLWDSATEELLAVVHQWVSEPLIDVLAGLGRVAFRFHDPVLARLPVETAHHDTGPALFELVATYRQVPPGPGCHHHREAPSRRRFTLSQSIADPGELPGLALERFLVAAAHRGPGRTRTGGSDRIERLIHIAGHEPRPEHGLPFHPGEAGHLVLSGCASYLEELPPGVASATCSLWAVDDEHCVSLMTAFHAAIARGIGPAEALRRAQLLHLHLPGLAWSAFVHVGAPA